MAARNITMIDWAKLAERVPKDQINKLLTFRTKSDTYLRRMMANPESAPKIDWEFYRKSVPVSGMVENFQKQYDSFKIPYPADTISNQIDSQEKEIKTGITEFVKESQQRIASYKAEIARLHALIPFEQMTMEDYRDAYPEEALDPLNRPTFWPHTPEVQLDYVHKDEQPGAH